MQVYRNCWQPSSKEKKTIPINANRDEVPKPNQKPTSYPIDVVWYGRLIVPKPRAKTDSTAYLMPYWCSQRSLKEWGKTGNIYVTLRQEMEWSCTWWRISYGMRTNERGHQANKDDMSYIKLQWSINRWQSEEGLGSRLYCNAGPKKMKRLKVRIRQLYELWLPQDETDPILGAVYRSN